MLPHQERVVEEAEELDKKLSKLQAFLSSTKAEVVSPAELGRLTRQSLIMQLYSDVLHERITAFLIQDHEVIIKQRLRELFKLIDSEELSKALKEIVVLRAALGEDNPDLIRAEALIRFLAL